MTDLDLSRVWLVDPARGREGPGELVVVDGILETVTWLDGAEADGIEQTGHPAREDTAVVRREPRS